MYTWAKIGIRNLFKNKRRSLFTIGAIALGFAAVNLFGGFTVYLYHTVEESFIYARGNGHLTAFKRGFLAHGALRPWAYLLSGDELGALTEFCAGDPRVVLSTPQIYLSGLVSNGRVSTIFVGAGRVPSDVAKMQARARGFLGRVRLFEGEPLEDGNMRRLGLSYGLADKLELSHGADLIVMAPTVDGQMNALDGQLAQTFQAPGEFMNDKMANLNLEFARALYDTKGADRLTLMLGNARDIPAVRRDLERFAAERNLDVEVQDWETLCPTFAKVCTMFNTIFSFVFVVVFVIVVLSVVNTLSMAVMERTREIGTLRALGLKRRGVTTMFATESALLGLMGCVVGLALTAAGWAGLRMAAPTWVPPNIDKRVPLEVYLVPEYLAAIGLFLVLLAAVAAVLPARRASRLSIIDALGHV